jgi:hypothetical protein
MIFLAAENIYCKTTFSFGPTWALISSKFLVDGSFPAKKKMKGYAVIVKVFIFGTLF